MQGIIGAIISSLGFGSANIVIKKSVEDIAIPKVLFMSFASGTVVAFIYLLFTNNFEVLSNEVILVSVVLAFGEIILYLLLYKSFSAANVTVATSVLGIYPVLITFASIFFFGYVVTLNEWIFIILMILGAALISIDWAGVIKDGLDKTDITKGFGWIALCTIAHAVYFTAFGNFTDSGSLLFKLFLIKSFASIIFFVLVFVIIKKPPIPEKKNLGALSLLGLLEMIGWIGYGSAIANNIESVGVVTAALNLGSLVTAVLAYIILKEKLKPFQYVGIIIMIVGLTLLGLVQS
jgi:drug/metabolite transporter (DMT)-like permease